MGATPTRPRENGGTDMTEERDEARCVIVDEAAEKLEKLGIDDCWECLAAGALMGAKFTMCEHHYRAMLQRVCDHVTSELVQGQLN
jgi:hypothetical protein